MHHKILLLFAVLIIFVMIIPQKFIMPVKGATSSSYHPKSFWYYPWGTSVTHKGVDIFAKEGTDVLAATGGLVVYNGELSKGGNVVAVIGPKFRIHYYAHLQKSRTGLLAFVKKGKVIGTVGTSGNAKGKAPHLHYSIVTPFPYFWRADKDRQGWKKMFYLNPIEYLKKKS